MAATQAAPAPRARRSRALNLTAAPVVQPVANVPVGATEQMIKLAQDAIVANAAKNKATRDEKSAIESLNKLMIEGGIKHFPFTTTIAGTVTKAEAVIAAGEKDVIDVALLRTLVDDATFMKIVKATKGDIETHCGKNMVIKVTSTKTTEEELKIKKVKV